MYFGRKKEGPPSFTSCKSKEENSVAVRIIVRHASPNRLIANGNRHRGTDCVKLEVREENVSLSTATTKEDKLTRAVGRAPAPTVATVVPAATTKPDPIVADTWLETTVVGFAATTTVVVAWLGAAAVVVGAATTTVVVP